MDLYNLNEEEEKKLILREYRALLRSLKSRIKKGDKARIRRAFELSAEAHKDMRRKSGEPYILHPLAVARIVVEEISLGVTSVICALMHDVVEDTEMTLDDMQEEFGVVVTKIIDGLTKIANVVDGNAETSVQAENFKKILIALAEDPRVILIKLADRLHNMRTLGSMARDKQLKICSETTYIYAPLAHRLGLYEIKSELEDLALKYTQPETYTSIANGLKQTKRERSRYINEFIKPIKEELVKMGFKFEIFGRPKSINSIWNKMRTKHVSFEEVYDLFAIRIVLDSEYEKEKEDCWKVYSMITNFYKPSPERMRDWLSVPKGNGYEALHTTVMGPGGKWVEVQIKSQRMNAIAEKGLAAHWKYKEGTLIRPQESKLDAWLQHLRDVINSNKDSDTLDFMQDFKLDLFTEEIYVYTPKGDMRVLPKGATALDFAFDIHSELGARCIGAKVNYKLVPLSHPLRSGDQIEVISSGKQKPGEDWLNFVITAKAKSRIKYYLKEQKRKIAEDGKELVERKLKHMGVPLNAHNANELAQHFKKTSAFDVYYCFAIGNIDPRELKDFKVVGDKLFAPQKLADNKAAEIEEDEQLKKPAKGAELVIFGESSDKILYKLANCCQPIPGDDVFGFITAGEGLKIHRSDCPNAARLLSHYGHRVVKTKWAKNKEISFLSGVRITGLDDVGVIKKITNVISDTLNMNMRSISIDSSEGIFEGTIMIYVHDKEEFDLLCNKLGALEGVITVERLETAE